MKSRWFVCLSLSLLAGCGGSTPRATAPPETLRTLGSLVTRIVGTAQAPVTSYGVAAVGVYEGTTRAAVVTGIAGASVTELSYRDSRPTSDADLRTVLTRDGDLFLANGVQDRLIRLTDTAAIESDPAISADGKRIVFVKNGDLFTINADGSGLTQLTSGPAVDATPDISGDGLHVVFSRRATPNSLTDLFTINTDGSALTLRTSRVAGDGFSDREPVFSPDGTRIAFIRTGLGPIAPDTILATMTAVGTGLVTVVSTTSDSDYFSSPSYSPDGARLAFIQTSPDILNSTQLFDAFDSTLFMVDATGANIRQLDTTKTLFSSVSRFVNTVWTADGQRIVYTNLTGNRDPNSNVPLPNTVNYYARTIRISDRQLGNLGFETKYLVEDLTGALPRGSVKLLGGIDGLLGYSAAGFFVAQANAPSHTGIAEPELASVLAFDTAPTDLATRSTARVIRQTEDNAGSALLVFHIQSGTTLKSINYAQFQGFGPGAPAPEIVSLTLPPLTTSALIGFHSVDGKVRTILPYAANRSVSGGAASVTREGGTLVCKGRFLGVFDSKGHNLTPGGATEVRLDAATGALQGTH